ncbi:MAG: metallophosphoesterase [Armatimonadota bacterium]|nr:metallophosphoesterase [Armatimonadota bacterium]MCX7776461.1 metallophosphoesterase [Armatimonadota bacterium]MDW8024259.1 metallophosphoesterase [Armatimonadota bacterium]
MKVGLIADTHDNMAKIEAAVKVFESQGVGLVIHAGDFVAPFSVKPFSRLSCNLVAVFGNNDGERIGLLRAVESFGKLHAKMAVLEVEGRSIAVIHEPEPLEAMKRSRMFDVIVYGHTHKLSIERDQCLAINPGEACGWLTGLSTVVVLDLENLEVTIHEL